jgi:hypothetical protein
VRGCGQKVPRPESQLDLQPPASIYVGSVAELQTQQPGISWWGEQQVRDATWGCYLGVAGLRGRGWHLQSRQEGGGEQQPVYLGVSMQCAGGKETGAGMGQP